MSEEEAKADIEKFRQKIGALREEIARVIVGHREVVDGVITCMLAGSHALLEGVPGLGKTMLVRTLAESVGLNFTRIQFTPDLMPADIIGTTVIEESSSGKHIFEFRKGPVFANIVLADEINRATPKTQSALLEAMQEHRVTVGRTTYTIEEPYFVLATQNPLEMEGTYPLPEAQLDRFFFKLQVPFPSREELHSIIERTTTEYVAKVEPVVSAEDILGMQKLVRTVPVARHVQDYAVRLLQATHPDGPDAPEKVRRFARVGASPRGAQAVLLAAKIRALFEGRFAASVDDVKASAAPALRHRMLLNFEGEAEGVKTDDCIREILEELPEAKT
ncbi:MAG: MoxR family ATPase [Polyangiaceae bacterium]|nr:MoxR family ATPase [Polyangiaceae bacterium]MCE7889051.1 MoxR family ATPase [Sorangiineae bacterium PRO1]MCL4751169.1 MoxR family ATPase [Myxococcales bacterium]